MSIPDFSIIVPVYNAATTIEATVASVLQQSFSNFELILIDDGSQDQSLTIIKTLAEHDARIKVLSWENRGVSATRNLGVEISRGELLAFLDADDLWHCDKLARHWQFHEPDSSADASYARIAFLEPSANSLHDARTTSSIAARNLTVTDLLGENPVCTMSNLVVRRKTFTKTGTFCEKMSFAEDQEWLARAASVGCTISGLDEVLVGYRLSHDGLSIDLDKMYSGWRTLAYQYEEPERLCAAEAVFCRYLARRALRSGASPQRALSFAIIGLKLDASAFLDDSRRGWLTVLAAILCPVIPRSARLRVFS